MEDLVSIIVPVYRVEKYLRKCLDSLIAQTYEKIEIILVNDGSPDNSPQICDEYAQADSRIKVIHQKNQGISAARNTGLSNISGEYVIFVDSDDWISQDTCERAVAAMKEQNVDIVFWSYVREYGDRSLKREIYDQDILFDGSAFNELFLRLLGKTNVPETLDSLSPVWNKMYKTKHIAENIRFVDTKFIGNEDLLYNAQVFLLTKRTFFLNETFYHYRKDALNSFTKGYKEDHLIKRKALFCELRNILTDNHGQEYYDAIDRRIALDILSQSLNIVQSGRTIREKNRLMRSVLRDEVYKQALRKLSIKGLRVHWKVYYGMAKLGSPFFVNLLTKTIIKLRRIR